MLIIIAHNITIHNPPARLTKCLHQDLTFPNPKYEAAEQYGYSTWGMKKLITLVEPLSANAVDVPRGYLPTLLDRAQTLELELEVHDNRASYPIDLSLDSKIILRDYQEVAVNELIANDYGVLKAPAGSGKTVMGLSLLVKLRQRMLWLTHTGPLARQAIERVNEFIPNVNPGFIGSGKWDVGDEITVAMVQTLVRNEDRVRDELAKQFGLVVLDEAHHAPATTFTKVVRQFPARHIYGLTATDERRDKLHHILYNVIGPITAEVDRTHIAEKLVTPTVHVKATGIEPDPDKDFIRLLRDLMFNEKRNDMIVADILNDAYMGNICIAITERVAHAELLYDKIKPLWDYTGFVTGRLTKKQIREQIRLLESQEITVLIATSNLLGEGFDHAPLSRLFICLPFRSETRCEQVVGRVQRTTNDKFDAFIYDYVDSHSLLAHQYYNDTGKPCRRNIYDKLDCVVEEMEKLTTWTSKYVNPRE